jgi:hypothetical protein
MFRPNAIIAWDVSNRARARLLALVVALFLSKSQYRFFDCNKMPSLSYVSGVATLLIIYGTAERAYEAITNDEPEEKRSVLATVVVGCIAIGGAGFFTMLTHICP